MRCWKQASILKAVALCMLLASSASHSDSSRSSDIDSAERYQLNVQYQTVEQALRSLANASSRQLLFPYDQMEALKSVSISGRYTLKEALGIILKGTSLSGELTTEGVILVTPIQKKSDRGSEMKNRKNLLASTIAFFVGAGGVSSGLAQESGAGQEEQAWVLEEIVVTATKRSTSLQDTAMAISALGADEIDKRGLVSMDDYLRNIPGVSMQDRGAAGNSIVIRGMATNPQDDDVTAGAYFGESPISDIRSANQTGAASNIDLKLVDIERVEVLRGPQGTLYGSGSMAGTVRTIPNAPKLDRVEGSIASRLSNTAEAGGNNYSVQAVINIPVIEDTIAVRAVAYQFDNSGYIDNVASSKPTDQITADVMNNGAVAEDKGGRGANVTKGFRLATLWRVTDQLDATLSYITQETEQDGLPEINLDAEGKFQQQRIQVGENRNQDEHLELDFELVNLVLNYDLGWGELSSSTSWIDNEPRILSDVSAWVNPGPHYNDNFSPTDIFVEELRLSSLGESAIDWVAGLYYEDKSVESHTFLAWAGEPSQDSGLPGMLDRVTDTEQIAAFGEMTYTLTEEWSATIGARYFDYDQEQVDTIVLVGSSTPFWENRKLATDETGHTFKGVVSYSPREDLLVYGQWAQGFRLGRPLSQSQGCIDAGIEVTGVDSDTADTFELGVKSSWNDNRITLNAAIYETDWQDMPIRLRTVVDGNLCSRLVNGGEAKSRGLEFELRALLADNLQLDISASTVKATLEETSNIGNKGDSLPGSADYNISFGFEYGFTLMDSPSFARVDYAYVGEYYNNVGETGIPAGDFEQVHAKVGTTIGQVNIDLFVNNLTNDDGLTWVESTLVRFSGGTSNRAYRIRPRTIGINVAYTF